VELVLQEHLPTELDPGALRAAEQVLVPLVPSPAPTEVTPVNSLDDYAGVALDPPEECEAERIIKMFC